MRKQNKILGDWFGSVRQFGQSLALWVTLKLIYCDQPLKLLFTF